jgi:hypothetical protein
MMLAVITAMAATTAVIMAMVTAMAVTTAVITAKLGSPTGWWGCKRLSNRSVQGQFAAHRGTALTI